MTARDHHSIYANEEFDEWANRQSEQPYLDLDERRLIERFFLEKDGPTLDGGTGGGRIALALANEGFRHIHGFDFVAESIERAKRRDPAGAVTFRVADARSLPYPSGSFRQMIYTNHLICFLEDPGQRRQALAEARRVLGPGGVAIFSTLAHEVRSRVPVWRTYHAYLRLLRGLRRTRRSIQLQPWAKLGGRWSRGALTDAPPYIYWYRASELAEDVVEAGFLLEGLATTPQATNGHACRTAEELVGEGMSGSLYAIGRVPS
jgi:ubiquinone/menaquinone biosynthesis C-methylase UbiE